MSLPCRRQVITQRGNQPQSGYNYTGHMVISLLYPQCDSFLLYKASICFPTNKTLVPEQALMKRNSRFQSFDDEFIKRSLHAHNGCVAGFGPDNKLCEQRIIVWRHRVASIKVAIHAHAGTSGGEIARDGPRLR